MEVKLSFQRLPVNPAVKERTGLPFGCSITPFAPYSQGELIHIDDVPRCKECAAYINHAVGIEGGIGWVCSLCGAYHDFETEEQRRRYGRMGMRDGVREISNEVYEAVCPLRSLEEQLELDGDAAWLSAAREGCPVFVALVDVTCSLDVMELIRASLSAAIEGLPPYALFGIITFANAITLWDVKSALPVSRSVPLFDDAPLLCPLADVLPLQALLAPIGLYKDKIAAAIDLLEPRADLSTAKGPLDPPEQQLAMASAALPAIEAQRTRGFGPALQAVLEYLQDLRSPPPPPAGPHAPDNGFHEELGLCFGPPRILAVLAGPPNLGEGRLDAASAPQPSRSCRASESGAFAQPGDSDAAASSTATAAAVPPADGAPARIDPYRPYAMQPASLAFYEQAAVAAASLGACVDVFAVSRLALGLSALEPLCTSTGGGIFLYTNEDQAAMPQDLFRRLATPHALACLLRVRTSPEWRVARCYGRLFESEQHQGVYHITACSPSDTVALDFEFIQSQGFMADDNNRVHQPVFQVAFQYSVVVPAGESASRGSTLDGSDLGSTHAVNGSSHGDMPWPVVEKEDHSGRKPGPTCQLERRVRIATYAHTRVGKVPAGVYDHANCSVVVSLLMHKILRAVQAEGVRSARLLLQDWLTVLIASFNHAVHSIPYGDAAAAQGLEVDFLGHRALQSLPRLTYALLRTPLLDEGASFHPDAPAFLRHLWSSLPPDELERAVYPVLSSWLDPDNCLLNRHTLSKAALQMTLADAVQYGATATFPEAKASMTAPIMFMDTYTQLIVLYRCTCPSDVPYPPPQTSRIQQLIKSVRQTRRITPQVLIMRENPDDPNNAAFFSHLIDEAESDASLSTGEGEGREAQQGIVPFLELMRTEACRFMAAQPPQ